MDVVILAGGKGTRLNSVVYNVPKPLAKIGKTPFLMYIFNKLATLEHLQKVVVAAGYLADSIVKYCELLSDKFLYEIVLSRENEPLGTGGACLKALSLCSSNNVLVLNGDSFIDFNFEYFYKHHIEKKSIATIYLTEVKDTSRFGKVEIDPYSSSIVKFNEKNGVPEGGYINAGVYLFQRGIFSDIQQINFSLENDFFPMLVRQKYMYGYLDNKNQFIDIGTPESYIEAQTFFN